MAINNNFFIIREEETVMDNLRKRVGELQLDKNWKRKPIEQENNNEEEKPLLKVINEVY